MSLRNSCVPLVKLIQVRVLETNGVSNNDSACPRIVNHETQLSHKYIISDYFLIIFMIIS